MGERKKCVLVYASMSGNTKRMAEAIAEEIIQSGCDLDVREMYAANASDLENYDCILLGSSTWGDGELPDEALCYYEEMESLNLHGKRAAVFGSGDSFYVHYGAAVDLLECKLREMGAEIVLAALKVDLTPSTKEIDTCRNFARAFVKQSTKAA